ncbi:MAG: flagellar M-ring protein FliF [bacterium]|nr:flagellar M-ring protein FliF [bacterium]
MAEVLGKFRELWQHMGMSQRLIFLSLTGAIAVTLLLFFTWLGKEDFTMLYSNLSPEDSSRMVEVLQKKNIDYRVSDSGSGILVQASRLGDAKVALASEGVPRGGVSGYELFDNQGIGVSEFTQDLNYRRALEGELSRSVATIAGIGKARVHLVMPKPALFKEDHQNPSASVVLNLQRPGSLRADQVQAVQQLIASSVEGLDIEQVTILDSFGTLLSRGYGDAGSGATTGQLEIKQEIESYLARKAQSTLESVLGAGAVLVRVNADLNFEQVERTREVVDPETSAVLSEQLNASKKGGGDESVESSTVNYEFNRMVENIIGASGNIENLSVAVMIDGNYTTDDAGEMTYAPRNAQEMEGYQRIVENIVGYNTERGDKIEVLNVQFTDHSLPEDGGIFSSPLMEKLPGVLNKVLFVAALFFLLGIFKKMSAQLVENVTTPTMRAVAEGAGGAGVGADGAGGGVKKAKKPKEISAEDMVEAAKLEQAERQMQMEEQAKALALEKPEDIAQLVRTWIYSG